MLLRNLRSIKRIFNHSTLRLKIVVMMSILVIITPTILVSMLAYSYYHFGIESLFHDKISRALSQSVDIAEAYVKEHKDNIRADALAISKEIERNYYALTETPSLFRSFLDKQVEIRNLSEISVFHKNRIIARNSFSLSTAFERLPIDKLDDLNFNDVYVLDKESDGRVKAIIRLNNSMDTFLFVSKFLDKSIINHLINTKGSKNTFNKIISESDKTRKKLKLNFIGLSLFLCLVTIFIGLRLAKNITNPINELVNATKLVSRGNYNINLKPKGGRDEISILTSAFNRMTDTINKQHNALIDINNLVDERRRFIETVLKEITSGILVVNSKGNITLYNESAAQLLGINAKRKNQNYKAYLPEIEHMFGELKHDPSNILQTEIIRLRDEKMVNFLIRLGLQSNNSQAENFIVSIDDITALVSAQRSAAWSDVARRVAHEIKNPLTPINLSAERISKKFTKFLSEQDAESLNKYTATIKRHVADIGTIIEDFIEFAKLPSPKLKRVDITQLIKDAIFSEQCIYKNIKYVFDSNIKKCSVDCDSTQINQVLINLLKNAAESIEQKAKINPPFSPLILVYLSNHPDSSNSILVTITDNGLGFSQKILNNALEPYVTTKVKGTGLGLAIVQKIIKDHGGDLFIKNTENGAQVSFSILIENKDNEDD